MFTNLATTKLKIIIAVFALLFLSFLIYLFFFKETSFDVIAIQKRLTTGNKEIFNTDIIWIENEDGSLQGTLNIEKIKYKVFYVLQKKSIESIVYMKEIRDLQDKIPCLNSIHLLSKLEIKRFYENIFKDSKISNEGYEIPVNNKIFIDYYQTKNDDGVILHCKIYYK